MALYKIIGPEEGKIYYYCKDQNQLLKDYNNYNKNGVTTYLVWLSTKQKTFYIYFTF